MQVMSQGLILPRYRTLAWAAYVCVFGAIWAFVTFGASIKNVDGTDDGGLLYVWVVMALVGSTIMALKNRILTDRGLRAKVSAAELAVVAVALVLAFAIPSYFGLVKGLVLLVVFGVYYYWFAKLMDAHDLC